MFATEIVPGQAGNDRLRESEPGFASLLDFRRTISSCDALGRRAKTNPKPKCYATDRKASVKYYVIRNRNSELEVFYGVRRPDNAAELKESERRAKEYRERWIPEGVDVLAER